MIDVWGGSGKQRLPVQNCQRTQPSPGLAIKPDHSMTIQLGFRPHWQTSLASATRLESLTLLQLHPIKRAPLL
jgi:hypothetical protein